MIEKIEGFEIYENKQSSRIINIDIGDEILNKLINILRNLNCSLI